MSVEPATEPLCTGSALPVIANVIDGRPRDLGGVAIRRVLPDVAGGGQSVILVAWLFLVVH